MALNTRVNLLLPIFNPSFVHKSSSEKQKWLAHIAKRFNFFKTITSFNSVISFQVWVYATNQNTIYSSGKRPEGFDFWQVQIHWSFVYISIKRRFHRIHEKNKLHFWTKRICKVFYWRVSVCLIKVVRCQQHVKSFPDGICVFLQFFLILFCLFHLTNVVITESKNHFIYRWFIIIILTSPCPYFPILSNLIGQFLLEITVIRVSF